MAEIGAFCPASTAEWRQWLQDNHRSEQSVWLLLYKLNSGKPTVSWSEAVDEALCFGWVDSRRKPVDEEKFMQFFCQRKPTSTWSKINKEKVIRLTEQGLMQDSGFACIDIARQNGSWDILNEVEAGVVPADLEAALAAHDSAEFFYGLSKSVRKAILQWLVLAKQPQTRLKRIMEIAELAAQKKTPKQF